MGGLHLCPLRGRRGPADLLRPQAGPSPPAHHRTFLSSPETEDPIGEPSRDQHPDRSRNDLSGESRDVVQAAHISGGVSFHYGGSEARASSVPTPRQLPADVRGFVNRVSELGELTAVLPDDGGGSLVVSVWVIAGTAGAGKTSLALRWAHQVQDRFPDGQLYVNLRGYDPGEPVTAEAALHRFLTALGVPAGSLPQDVDAAAALYRSVLAERRMLIVLDNAVSAGQVRPLLPGGAGNLTVVTSRSRLSGLAVRDGARRLTLGTLPQPEAVALLRAVTAGYRAEDGEDRLAELADLCARLPLALRIAAERAAAHPHMRLDDLIADLRDESALWDALSTGDDEEAEAVRTVFAWSYRALPVEAARLFRLLGLHPGSDFGVHATAALAQVSTSRARHLLDVLVGAHLVEQTGPGRYEFHDLLRAYATDQARHEEPPDERGSALRRVLDWYLHTADAAQGWIRPHDPHVPLDASTAGLPPLTFPDYDAAVDWAEREHHNLLRGVRAAADLGEDRLAWQLCEVLWLAQYPSAPDADWISVAQTGLAAARRAGDRRAEGRLLTDLGRRYAATGRLRESLDRHREALAIWRDLDEGLAGATALNLIGLIHLRTRHLEAAADHFLQALAAFREEGSAYWVATALSNLATTRQRAGDPEALTVAHEALAAHRALDNRRGEGNILRIIARLEAESGDTERALKSARAAVDIALNLRDEHLEAYWLLPLGDAERAAGRPDDALVSYQRSGALHRRLRTRDREALAWQGAGEAHAALGRPDEAAHFHRLAAAVHRQTGDRWNEALALEGLGSALSGADPQAARGAWTEAARLLAEAGWTDPRASAVAARVRRRLDDGT